MLADWALGIFGGIMLLFSFFGNSFFYWYIAVEEERVSARAGYYAIGGLWSLLNLGIVGFFVWRCFV